MYRLYAPLRLIMVYYFVPLPGNSFCFPNIIVLLVNPTSLTGFVYCCIFFFVQRVFIFMYLTNVCECSERFEQMFYSKMCHGNSTEIIIVIVLN